MPPPRGPICRGQRPRQCHGKRRSAGAPPLAGLLRILLLPPLLPGLGIATLPLTISIRRDDAIEGMAPPAASTLRARVDRACALRRRFSEAATVPAAGATADVAADATLQLQAILDEFPFDNSGSIDMARLELAFVRAYLALDGRGAAALFRSLVHRPRPEPLHLAFAGLFLTFFPESRSDIFDGERFAKAAMLQTEMSTLVLGGERVRKIASMVIATSAAALGREKESLMFYGAPFADISGYDRKGMTLAFLSMGLWPAPSLMRRGSKFREYCSWRPAGQSGTKGQPLEVGGRGGAPFAERGALVQGLADDLARYFRQEGPGTHFDGYNGDLRSYFLPAERLLAGEVGGEGAVGLVETVARQLFGRLPASQRARVQGIEWWAHRRPWHGYGAMYGEEETATVVIPGMRLHVDGDHVCQQQRQADDPCRAMHTTLLYLGDPVGSPTVIIDGATREDKDTLSAGGAWFFEGMHGDLLHFDGGTMQHGALPAVGTFGADTWRIVVAFAFWQEPCSGQGRVCRHARLDDAPQCLHTASREDVANVRVCEPIKLDS